MSANQGYINTASEDATTEAHEYGHGLFGDGHPDRTTTNNGEAAYDNSDGTPVPIMYPSAFYVKLPNGKFVKSGTVRKVTSADIARINLNNAVNNKNGVVSEGATFYTKDGKAEFMYTYPKGTYRDKNGNLKLPDTHSNNSGTDGFILPKGY